MVHTTQKANRFHMLETAQQSAICRSNNMSFSPNSTPVGHLRGCTQKNNAVLLHQQYLVLKCSITSQLLYSKLKSIMITGSTLNWKLFQHNTPTKHNDCNNRGRPPSCGRPSYRCKDQCALCNFF